MTKGASGHLACEGAEIRVRVTPLARQPGVTHGAEGFSISVTAPADEGRANAAVVEALAHALGVANSRLTLVRRATARDKTFRLD